MNKLEEKYVDIEFKDLFKKRHLIPIIGGLDYAFSPFYDPLTLLSTHQTIWKDIGYGSILGLYHGFSFGVLLGLAELLN